MKYKVQTQISYRFDPHLEHMPTVYMVTAYPVYEDVITGLNDRTSRIYRKSKELEFRLSQSEEKALLSQMVECMRRVLMEEGLEEA